LAVCRWGNLGKHVLRSPCKIKGGNMAKLLDCPTCGNPCSENASSCPQCGEPFYEIQDHHETEYQTTGGKLVRFFGKLVIYGGAVFGGLLLISVLSNVFSDNDHNKPVSGSADRQEIIRLVKAQKSVVDAKWGQDISLWIWMPDEGRNYGSIAALFCRTVVRPRKLGTIYIHIWRQGTMDRLAKHKCRI
jgi:hypothetical protein